MGYDLAETVREQLRGQIAPAEAIYDLDIYVKPGPGQPGADGADGFVVITWEKTEEERNG